MKVSKIELYVIDFDQLGVDEIVNTIQNASYPNDCIWPHVIGSSEVDIGEWRDDHPLNVAKTAKQEIERLFGTEVSQ